MTQPKKAVVTGGAGFIGSTLVRALIAQGWETHIIDRDAAFRRTTLPSEAILHEVDIRDTEALTTVMQGADSVFHLAAVPRVQYSIEEPVETTDENVTGTVSVLHAASRAKVRRFVFSSSGATYGLQATLPFTEDMQPNPVHPYGLQKAVGELFCKMFASLYGVETVCLRYSNVYGPGLDPNGPYALAVGKFLDARIKNTPITIFGDGTVTRDFIHVDDVVRANILAAESAQVGKGDIINISTGRNLTIKYIAELFGGEINYGPARHEEHDSVADNSKAKRLLDWAPTITLEDGIAGLKKGAGIE
jgi:nucleoside-diphosphate-sugar epimerase